MRPSMNARASMETDQPSAPAKAIPTLPYIIGCVVLGLLGIGSVLAYKGFTNSMEAQINSIAEVSLFHSLFIFFLIILLDMR
jgi:hypothetical protein